jgi:phosphate-selective porin OprO/OprP
LTAVSLRRLTAAMAIAAIGCLARPTLAQPGPGEDRRGSDERGALRLGGGGDVTLTLGGYVQTDGRWISGAGGRQPDGLLLRRARLVFDAAVAEGWHVRLQPDFGQGRVLLQDAYVGRERGTVTMRAGRFRPPFGTERMQSSSTLLSPERGIVNALMPSRSFGAALGVSRGAWRLTVGGFRTPIGSDAIPVDTDGDVDAGAGSGHDLLVRLSHASTWNDGYADIQAGVLAGSERGTPESPALARVLSVAQQPILVFRGANEASDAARAAGARHRVAAGATLGNRATMVALEGALFAQQIEYARAIHRPTIGAGTLRVARVFNGRRSRLQEITPRSPSGAFDVGVRGGVVGTWGEGLSSVVTRGSVTHARTAGLAFSWLPSSLTRMTIAYDVTERRRSSAPREHALFARWQQGF